MWDKLRIAAAVAAVVLGIGTAQAQTPNWSGFYVGAHAGYGWGEWNGPLSYDDHDPKWPQPQFAFDDTDKTIEAGKWLGGVQIGVMHQMGAWVAGLEADVSWTDIQGFGSFLPYPNNPGSPAWDIETKMDLLGTVRGRLGLAQGKVLTYVTGGFAWARSESSIQPMYGAFSNGLATADHFHTGWVLGGGMEVALGAGWTMRAEYLYIDLGRVDYAYMGKTAGGQPYDTDHFHPDLTVQTVRLGVNYKFGAPK